jgi:hypothetical protein
MSIGVLTPGRIPMSQKERDVLKILHAVLRGERTQAEAARPERSGQGRASRRQRQWPVRWPDVPRRRGTQTSLSA